MQEGIDHKVLCGYFSPGLLLQLGSASDWMMQIFSQSITKWGGGGGDRGAGGRENRGREGYGRREIVTPLSPPTTKI